MTLASTVTTSDSYVSSADGKYKVVALDFGIKQNIINELVKKDICVEVVPAGITKTIIEDPDGVFLSNGPGDPAAVTYAIETIQELVKISKNQSLASA